MKARATAEKYVALTRAGQYDELGSLWAEDAVFNCPNGEIIRGRKDIGEFYSKFLRTITPDIRAARFADDEAAGVCVMELESRMSRDAEGHWKTDPKADYTLSAIDRFTVNSDGLITHMIVYLAPDSRWVGA